MQGSFKSGVYGVEGKQACLAPYIVQRLRADVDVQQDVPGIQPSFITLIFAFLDLDDVIAELGCHRPDDLTRLRGEGSCIEGRHHLATAKPAQVATAGPRAGIIGILQCQVGEILPRLRPGDQSGCQFAYFG